MRSPHQILLRPRITEKGSSMSGDGRPLVVFEVARDATKTEIKNAVQAAFNVEVAEVRTLIMRGKEKRRARTIGRRQNWKKAIVKLKEGFEIDFFGGIAAS